MTGSAGEVILMGPPGVGKGTQARLLTELNGWLHLATGDLFRDHARRETALGKLAQSYMEKGEYVPDEVTVDVVRERLAEAPPATRVVFDGFPRTVAQAESLDNLLQAEGRSVGLVILLELPRETLVERVAGRATCALCQSVYSLSSNPPRVAGVCDRCGGPVASTARPDESPEVIRQRLIVYEEQTKPVADYYEARGILHAVDADGSIADITNRLQRLVVAGGEPPATPPKTKP